MGLSQRLISSILLIPWGRRLKLWVNPEVGWTSHANTRCSLTNSRTSTSSGVRHSRHLISDAPSSQSRQTSSVLLVMKPTWRPNASLVSLTILFIRLKFVGSYSMARSVGPMSMGSHCGTSTDSTPKACVLVALILRRKRFVSILTYCWVFNDWTLMRILQSWEITLPTDVLSLCTKILIEISLGWMVMILLCTNTMRFTRQNIWLPCFLLVKAVLVNTILSTQNTVSWLYLLRLRTGSFLNVIIMVEEVFVWSIGIAQCNSRVGSEPIEVRVLEGLLGCKSFLGVKCHHFHHNIYCLFWCIRYQLLQWSGNKFREGKSDFGCQLVPFRPLGGGGTSHNSASLINLVCLIITRKKRSQKVQLCHYSPTRKDVNWRIVVCRTEQNFRSSIPPCTHVISEGWSGPDFSSESKIGNFNSFSLDQQVFRLHITVEKAMLMHVRKSLQSLVHYRLNLGLWKFPCTVFHQLVNVLFHVLEDKVKVVINSDDFFQFHNVGMVEFAQRLNFTQSHTLLPRIELLLHLLYSYFFIRLLVYRFYDWSIGSVT